MVARSGVEGSNIQQLVCRNCLSITVSFHVRTWRERSPIILSSPFLAIGLLLSCGKVGAPLPPGVVYPDTINNLRVEAGNRGPRLVFRLPSNDVEYVEVYRQCPPLVVEERSLLIARLFQDELVEARQVNQFVFEDGDQTVRAGCRYALKFVDSTGFQSEYSNFVAWTKGSNP